MKVEAGYIQFRIDINFEDSDVDMVYKETRSKGVAGMVPSILVGPDNHKCTSNKTPTEGTVDFCLNWLSGFVDRDNMCIQERYKWNNERNKTELEKLGVDVISTYGLMMGCCHLICEVEQDIYSPELVQKAIEVTNSIFSKYIRYHKKAA